MPSHHTYHTLPNLKGAQTLWCNFLTMTYTPVTLSFFTSVFNLFIILLDAKKWDSTFCRIIVLKLHFFICSIVSLAISTTIDRLFYGKWIFVQYNFLHFNVVSGGGSFYGTHPWHWYITQGYPVVMGIHLIPFMFGAWKAKNKVLLFVILWTVFIYRWVFFVHDSLNENSFACTQ